MIIDSLWFSFDYAFGGLYGLLFEGSKRAPGICQ